MWNFLWEQWPHRGNQGNLGVCRSQMIKPSFLQQVNVRRKWGQYTRMVETRVVQNKDTHSVKPKANMIVSLSSNPLGPAHTLGCCSHPVTSVLQPQSSPRFPGPAWSFRAQAPGRHLPSLECHPPIFPIHNAEGCSFSASEQGYTPGSDWVPPPS